MSESGSLTPNVSPRRPFPDIIINNAGRLRSGWRFSVFTIVWFVTFIIVFFTFRAILNLLIGNSPELRAQILEGNGEFITQSLLMLLTASAVGAACGFVFENLPPRALGWNLHQSWLRDLLIGSLIGSLSMFAATAIAAAPGGFIFALNLNSDSFGLVGQTIVISLLIFVLGAAAEEALFRGYPLQTVMRSWPVWIALVPSSLIFAYVHLSNPNVNSFTFVNTTLAGVWLAVAYVKTRSLWFPLGVHWSWNWTMGALLGLPVSGITEITPAPLLQATDRGPEWLTGGGYGIEGGAACTVALLLSTLFLWRTRIIGATEEMRLFTDAENPNLPIGSITNFEERVKTSEPPISN